MNKGKSKVIKQPAERRKKMRVYETDSDPKNRFQNNKQLISVSLEANGVRVKISGQILGGANEPFRVISDEIISEKHYWKYIEPILHSLKFKQF
jgi:hypothetical protein